MAKLKHFSHEHELILNEAEPVVCIYVKCVMCRQPINKLIDAFYTCNATATDASSSSTCVGFFMHKTCFELPLKFTHPKWPQHPLTLSEHKPKKKSYSNCITCKGISQGFMYDFEPSYDPNSFICLKCVTSNLKSREVRTSRHRGHNHPLTLVQRPALFLCDACNTTATDLSYICTECCFYIHKSCANAPKTYQSKFHKHRLILDYSFPDKYVVYCSICNEVINPIHWVYWCANCRFFAHLKCASLTEMLSLSDDDDSGESNLMHFPAHDEQSLHEMMQQCIMTKAKDALMHNSAIAEPSPYIKHWAHKHQLALRNKNANTSTLDLNQKLEDTKLLICDGCTKPISLVDDDIFYECISCNFFLHRSCAQFPVGNMEHHLAGKLDGGVLAREVDELASLVCKGCDIRGNGIFLFNETAWLDIGCASLPRKIKHEGHRHPLEQLKYPDDNYCKACWREYAETEDLEAIMYGCEKCEFYIHIGCALRPHLVEHRWDPHPLYLTLFVQNVDDHPHDFDCEFCSTEINPKSWFYHCNTCDQSLHIHCIDPFLWCSNMKFGATNFPGYTHSHPHDLTLVLFKKKRRCKICGKDAFGTPVLECSPCKYIVHKNCFINESE